MQIQVGLSLMLALSVTSALYGMNGESSAQDLLAQMSRSNDLVVTVEKISQLETRYAKANPGQEKNFLQKMLDEEKQNFYIQNKMMKVEKVRSDSLEEDELYDSMATAWKEYAEAEKPVTVVQAGVKDGAKKLNGYYYSQMSHQMSQAHERSQQRDSLMFGSLIVQAMLAGFMAMSLIKPKKKKTQFTVIPISGPKKKTEGSDSSGSSGKKAA